MTDTTAKIRAKGLDATGVTEEIANQMYTHRGRHYMAIVELKVDETHDKADGTHKVDLILTQVEPATTADLEEHLRELTRTLYFNRGDGHQPTLPGHDEPTVEGVLAAGAKHRPHPFLPVNAGENDTPICDVCGLIQAAGVHSTQETLDDPDEDDEPCEQLADEDGPHEYEPGPDDSCLHCGQAEHEDYATDDVETPEESADLVDANLRRKGAAGLASVPDPFTTPA